MRQPGIIESSSRTYYVYGRFVPATEDSTKYWLWTSGIKGDSGEFKSIEEARNVADEFQTELNVDYGVYEVQVRKTVTDLSFNT